MNGPARNPHAAAALLFKELVELSSAEQAARLDRLAADDPVLAARVQGLLAADAASQVTGYIEAGLSVGIRGAIVSLDVGERVDSYVIQEKLGEGGMGTVYRALQDSPRRTVAIKVIKPGMDSSSVLRRFENERQSLGLMDHAGIARIFDAGATSRGFPYFVMELIEGQSITAFCDRHASTIRERLVLFATVCDALQHAHMKGIIHRDLKPSNILVSMRDDGPVAKIIDFGIAKAIGETEGLYSRFTQDGQFVGTLEYMSPEQAQAGGVDVDTRSDVYSLGVVLYELLTGLLPYESAVLRSGGYESARAMIREREVPRPSTRLHAAGGDSARIASSRRTITNQLIRQFRRELDWILLKALRKDRSRRYSTPGELADDIRRYLAGRALHAAPESAVYIAGKFFQRHRLPVIAALCVLVAMAAGIVSTLWKSREANEQRDRAVAAEIMSNAKADDLQRVVAFQADQLASLDPTQMAVLLRGQVLGELSAASPDASTAPAATTQHLSNIDFVDISSAILDEIIFQSALDAIESDSHSTPPLVRAQLLESLARAMCNVSVFYRASTTLEQALDLRIAHSELNEPATVECMLRLADLWQSEGRLDEAEYLVRWGASLVKGRVADPSGLASLCKAELARVLRSRGRFVEAHDVACEALEGLVASPDADDTDRLRSNMDMAGLSHNLARFEEATFFAEQAEVFADRIFRHANRESIAVKLQIADLLVSVGEYPRAHTMLDDLLQSARTLLGSGHYQTLQVQYTLGRCCEEEGLLTNARSAFLTALNGRRSVFGEDHMVTLSAERSLARVLIAAGELLEAELYLRHILAVLDRAGQRDSVQGIAAQSTLGMALIELGRLEEAESFCQHAMEASRRCLGPLQQDSLTTLSNLALLRVKQGELHAASELFKEVYAGRLRILGAHHSDTQMAALHLASILIRVGQISDAERLLATQSKLVEGSLHAGHPVRELLGRTAAECRAAGGRAWTPGA